MNVSLYQAAAGMQATSRWQDSISENLASSALAGHKRRNFTFSAVAAGVLGTRVRDLGKAHALPQLTTGTDFRPGELKPGSPSDLAIEGRGFFEITLPNGRQAYTRDGEFHVNRQGQLVTKQGYAVNGSLGPIQMDPAKGDGFLVSTTGDVSQGKESLGAIRVVDFATPERLTSAGEGVFLADDPALIPQPATDFAVRQGALESSNTSSVLEMADLITSARLFEANQRVAQAQDDRLGRLIADVGNPT